MYKRRLLRSLLTERTPDYPGRGFLTARLEGLEYAILLSFADSASSLLRYRTSAAARREVLFEFGKLSILWDDIQDEREDLLPDDELRRVLLGEAEVRGTDLHLVELGRSVARVLETVSRTPWSDAYREALGACFDSQRVAEASRQDADAVARTLEASERKGGAFALVLAFLLDPEEVPDPVREATHVAGSWVQAIDDYADVDKDRSCGIHTVFTSSPDPDATFAELTTRYRRSIVELVGREDYLVPLTEDLTALARFSRRPLVRPLFAALNG